MGALPSTSCHTLHIKTDMTLKDFSRNSSQARGVLNVELTIGSKTLPITFFVIDGKGSYSLLVGRDWNHKQGNDVEVVSADTTVNVATDDASAWKFDGIEWLPGKAWV
jgi:hypothetical protein